MKKEELIHILEILEVKEIKIIRIVYKNEVDETKELEFGDNDY